jgi:hypothetical protein
MKATIMVTDVFVRFRMIAILPLPNRPKNGKCRLCVSSRLQAFSFRLPSELRG